ncbi:hypothetical protein JAAARDRAFT_31124 [Jaapia argillacea MUCL 33604]|uniref:ATP-dependent DNA ligase family profile domain-containing protein n=1 Tax=Jaapia argillacea MUCL 33604 TaxID=933084 RepID=A0A067Q3V1_9AGAM|nr:hypothetical protein JAAARDRAFT_31124 [Jaapia argillacea MUCL 33604]
MDEALDSGIPFSFFISLLREISQIRPKQKRSSPPYPQPKREYAALLIFRRWIAELRRRYSPLPDGTTSCVFRLLFPEEDSERKYDMQESRLAHHLSNIFGLSTAAGGRGQRLIRWKEESRSGCLGSQVKNILVDSSVHLTDATGSLTITEVDRLLNHLAATSAFSGITIRSSISSRRPKPEILRKLYDSLPPSEASFLTQIILKDLRPVLYPPSATHFTAALKQYQSNAVIMLSREDAMKAWDPSGMFLQTYRVVACLDAAAMAFERNELDQTRLPKINSPVEIPKCLKGQGCAQALRLFKSSHCVWAETKYDGERAQIHVEIIEGEQPRIKIFSKSKRDSTWDRIAIHPIICRALGLSSQAPKIRKNIIVEAEMVPFSECLSKIDEFWRIRSLIETTAQGPRASRRIFTVDQTQESLDTQQQSMKSDASDAGARHLALVFFDVLLLDSISQLNSPYSSRRALLESVMTLLPGYAMLAERHPVVLRRGADECRSQGEEDLRAVFAKILAQREEGVVLKADEGLYNDWKSPWVKLKKDYIPGHGDTVDLAIVGAAWHKDRGRELRVPPTTYTTFYLGLLANSDTIQADVNIQPHFEVFFTVSYGLNRDHLEEVNFLIKSSDTVKYSCQVEGLPYTFKTLRGLAPPDVMLVEPLLADLYGAGFTKAPGSKYYELRFPRLTKVYRPSERPWRDGLTTQSLQRIARESVGKDRPGKDVNDWCKDLWGKPTSPGVRNFTKIRAIEDGWVEKLSRVDRVRVNNKRKRIDDENGGGGEGRKRARSLKPFGSVTNVDVRHNGQEMVLASETKIPVLEGPGPLNLGLATPPSSSVTTHTGSGPTTVNATTEPIPGLAEIDRDAEDESLPEKAADLDHQCAAFMVSNHTLRPDGCNLCPPMIPHTKERGIAADKPPDQSLRTAALLLGDHDPRSPSWPFRSSAVAQSLLRSLVWLARPCNAPRHTWRPSCGEVLPPGSQIHGLNALLIGCGWCEGATGSDDEWDRGVVFVDRESGDGWREYALTKLMQRSQRVMRSGRKVIDVYDLRMIGYEALHKCKDVDQYLVQRFV